MLMPKLKRQSITGFLGFTDQSQLPVASPPAFFGKCISLLPKAAGAKEKQCGLQCGLSGEIFMGVSSATATPPSVPELMLTLPQLHSPFSVGQAVWASFIAQPTPSHMDIFAFSQCDYLLEIKYAYQQSSKHSFIVWSGYTKQYIWLLSDSRM